MRKQLLTTIAICTASCTTPQTRYGEVFDLENQAWPTKSSIIFDYHNPPKLTNQKSSIYLTARIDKSFIYKYLALEIKTVKPDKAYWCDTLVVELSQKVQRQDRTLTTGPERRIKYRSATQLPQPGKWSFSIRQLNAPAGDTLHGVRALALELVNE